jgi:hypothetical protein
MLSAVLSRNPLVVSQDLGHFASSMSSPRSAHCSQRSSASAPQLSRFAHGINQPYQSTATMSKRLHQPPPPCLRVNHDIAHVGFPSNCGEPSPPVLCNASLLKIKKYCTGIRSLRVQIDERVTMERSMGAGWQHTIQIGLSNWGMPHTAARRCVAGLKAVTRS